MKLPLAIVATTLALASACNGTFRFDVSDAPNDAGTAAEASVDARSTHCSNDAACALPGLRCDQASGRCVACVGDSDCGATGGRCDLALHVCIECRETADCKTNQRCDDTTHTCLDTCNDDDDACPAAGFVCDWRLKLCIECHESEHCTDDAQRTRCDRDIGRCVECLAHAQCPSERPRCDRRTGACVGCVTAADCADGEACAPTTSTCSALP